MFTGRSYSQIYNEMQTEKLLKSTLLTLAPTGDTYQTFLDDLNSTTKVAIWRCFCSLVSFSIYVFEQIMVNYRTEVDDVISNSYVGSVKWYISKALQFQTGDSLILDEDDYSINYATLDTTKQIIGSAVGTESGGILYLKVRRIDTDILSVSELSEFTSYVNYIKFAGCRIIINNYNADKIKLYMNIIYNPQLNLNTIKSDVYEVINDYIINIEFNSKFSVNSLTDKLQLVDGVIDPQFDFTQTMVKTDTGDYQTMGYTYNSLAGYFAVDGSYPLTSTITFTKNS